MNKLKKIYLGLILFFLYAPIGVLIALSFNESKSRGKWTGFTFKWYIELFNDPQIMRSLYVTFMIAIFSALIATVMGTAAAIGIHSMPKWRKKLVMNITNIPVLNPDIVTGVSLMILYIFFFSIFKVGGLGFATLLISHTVFNVPYVILSVLPKLKQLDTNLYEAALDLGAHPVSALLKVILPEIMPGIVTGAILSFTLSLDDFIISFFTTGSGVSTLSITVFSMTKRGINPKINAISAIMFLTVMLLLILINKRDEAESKRKGKINENY